MDKGLVPGVRKIAVLRANALGDLVLAMPAIQALRQAYPQAEIVLLGLEWHKHFLERRPGPVDRVIVVPPSRGIHEDGYRMDRAAELADFFEAMQRESFDLAVQVHGGGSNSNPFIKRLRAKLTVGLKDVNAAELDRWVPYVYYQPEILRYLEVVSLVGAKTAELEPHVAVTEADMEEARDVVPEGENSLVCIHPGSGAGRRRWSPEKFAEVGDALAGAGATVVVTGTREERDLTRHVVSSINHDPVDAGGKLSLGGLAGLLSRCRVVVSNDSGPLHLAGAVGAATVGIYWCGNLINAEPLSRSRHRAAISWRLNCPVCGANCIESTCNHDASFVDDVPVLDVVSNAIDLLGTVSGAKHQVLQVF